MRHVRLLPWLMLPLLAACGGGNAPSSSQGSNADTSATMSAEQPADTNAAGDQPQQTAQADQSAPAQPQQAAVSATDLPATARPLLGTWAPSLDQCGDTSVQTVVTAARFESPERSCPLALTDNGDGTFTLACGKEKVKMTPIFAPTGEGINLVGGDGSKQTVLRCQ